MEKKRGRPSTGLYRKKQIKIYVTENEYERIRYLAEVRKLSVNKFILQKILNQQLTDESFNGTIKIVKLHIAKYLEDNVSMN